MSDMSQAERQIFILMLLSENKRGYSAEELRSRLISWGADVDVRTVRRDIDSLSGICFITEEVHSGTAYFSADKFKLENLTFDSEDLISLTFLMELLHPYENSSMGKNALSFLNRIIEHTGNLNREFVQYFHDYVSLNTNSYHAISDSNPEYEKLLQQAITGCQKVRILYQGFRQEQVSERIIHPYEFILREGNLTVSGYCELRNSLREFRLSRIRQLELLTETFTRQTAPGTPVTRDRFLHLSGAEKENILLRFHGEAAAYVREYDSALADKLETATETDGSHSVLFHRTAAITNDLIRWILGYGDGVEVLEPINLREMIRQRLQTANNQYQS